MTCRLAVSGATGRMGRAVLAAADRREDCDVVLALNRNPGTDAVEGVAVEAASEAARLVPERDPDVLVDFTGPESSATYAGVCADAGVALVVGTTGFDDDELASLRDAAEAVPVLRAANFARGVQALLSAVREAVAAMPDADVELVETHRAGKRDAPSGTAKRLLRAVEDVRGPLERVNGRAGEAPRGDGDVGVHSLRAGDASGEHEVVLAGRGEQVRLTHRAGDRSVFAAGALDAATWLAGRDPGWYDFEAVLGEPP